MRFHRAPLTLLATLALSGCPTPDYESIDIYVVGSSNGASALPLTVREGGVLLIEAYPRAEGNPDYSAANDVDLRAVHTGIAGSRRSILSNTWVISGAGAGATSLDVVIDDRVVDSVPVFVEVQSP